jgi:hypothetical protein
LDSQTEFKQFYNDVLKDKIDKLEQTRIAVNQKRLWYTLIPIIFFVAFIPFFPMILGGSFLLIPILIYTYRSISSNNSQVYRSEFGDSVIAAMVAHIDLRLTYTQERGIMFQAIQISRLRKQ